MAIASECHAIAQINKKSFLLKQVFKKKNITNSLPLYLAIQAKKTNKHSFISV